MTPVFSMFSTIPFQSFRWIVLSSAVMATGGACSIANELPHATIRVLTYNVQFLPEPASAKNERPDPAYRAGQIAEQVSRFDLVGLQETFHTEHRRQILDQVRQRWRDVFHLVESPTPEGFFTSGGCLIATRLPILCSNSTVYKHFSKPSDFGLRADGYAAKGVIHARVARSESTPEDFIDVFATHLEARDDDLRPLQYGELATFVGSRSSAAHPAIVLGDMNTRGAKPYRDDPESQYSQLVKQLQGTRPEGRLIDVWPYLKGDALGGTTEQESHEIGKRIDYLFVLNPPQPNPQLVPISVDVLLFQDPRVVALSDHNAVAAELRWEGKK